MRFRAGLLIGFGAGYYLGAKAGRERYEQMRRWVERVRPLEKAEAAIELARERLREAPTAPEAVLPPSSN